MISILTSTYNNEDYLGEFLESVINQTYTDWELILIDDGSTDSTKEIVGRFKDPRIRYFYKEHTNLTHSLNFGYRYCTGDYIARADADDVMLPHRLQWQYDFMESHKDVDMMSTAAYVLRYKDGQWKKSGITGHRSWYPSMSDMARRTCLWHGSWIVRGSSWRRDNILYDEKYLCGQDLEYMLNCIAHGWVLYNDKEITVLRRIHDKCTVVTRWKEVQDNYRKIREDYAHILCLKNTP